MFGFLKARRERAEASRRQQQATAEESRRQQQKAECLQVCERELDRTARALAAYANSPRDLAERAAMLGQAQSVALSDHPIVVRLEFLQRLLTALDAGTIDEQDTGLMERFISEGERLGLGDTNGINIVRRSLRLAKLRASGPQPQFDATGRAVYVHCEAEYKNRPGTLEVSAEGLTFLGEVRVEIPWPAVDHMAQTTHTYRGLDSPAVAVQERKRRTATKFVFPDGDADYTVALILAVWARVGTTGSGQSR
jgi:hypothetical protein